MTELNVSYLLDENFKIVPFQKIGQLQSKILQFKLRFDISVVKRINFFPHRNLSNLFEY